MREYGPFDINTVQELHLSIFYNDSFVLYYYTQNRWQRGHLFQKWCLVHHHKHISKASAYKIYTVAECSVLNLVINRGHVSK